MRAAMPSMAAAICGSCPATAVGTVTSSPFMTVAISSVDSRSISASSGRNASVVRVSNSRRSSVYWSVMCGSFILFGWDLCGVGGWGVRRG